MKGKIFRTFDYSVFKFLPENRELIDLQKNKIKSLMQLDDDLHLHPIIVNENMEIVDGQHRFEAAKALDREIFYVIDDNYNSHKLISINTSQRTWSTANYLRYWCQHSGEDYLKLARFMKEKGLSLQAVFHWLDDHETCTGSNCYNYKFKHGLYKFNPTEKDIELLEWARRFMEYLRDKNYKPLRSLESNPFHKGLKRFLTSPFVNKESFFQKLQIVPFTFHNWLYYGDYLEQLVNIYNFRRSKDKLQIVKCGKQVVIEAEYVPNKK